MSYKKIDEALGEADLVPPIPHEIAIVEKAAEIALGASDHVSAERLRKEADRLWLERDQALAAQRESSDLRAKASRVSLRSTLLSTCGFPERAIYAAIDDFDRRNPASVALNALPPSRSSRSGKTVVVLSGGLGCGKTVAATRWVAEGDDTKPLFVRAAAFEAIGRYDRKWRERWTTASSMVLDDLGAEYGDAKENFLAILDELFDVVYSHPIPCVVTTNLLLKDFRLRYGERIYSRLRECAEWRNVSGPDLRGRKD